MTGTAMLAAIRETPTDMTARLVYADWLQEFGTEDNWQAYLDLHPDHHEVRVRFGDWLEERGDRRADGYRALGILQLRTGSTNQFPCWWSHKLCVEAAANGNDFAQLPADWFLLLKRSVTGGTWWRDYLTRREAEDAAARAFSKLSARRRAELLTKKEAVPNAPPQAS